MRLGTSDELKELEVSIAKQFSHDPEVLMEAAGCLSAREIEVSFLPELSSGRVAVVCGPGHNGADGLVTARFLSAMGYQVSVYLMRGNKESSALYIKQLDRLRAFSLKITDLDQNFELSREISSYPIVIDALFGIGLSKPLTGKFYDLIQILKSQSQLIVSLDTPSGLHSDTGEVLGTAVSAAMTLTFTLSKPGFYIGAGPDHVGRVRVLSLGISRATVRKFAKTHYAFNEKLARRYIPARPPRANKSDFGHALVIAGSPTMWGAAHLGVEGAFRMGAGYVSLAVEAAHLSYVKEVGAEAKIIDRESQDLFKSANAILIGPGAGVTNTLKKVVERALTENIQNVILDADAISVLGQMAVDRLPKSWILTPHTGELSRLIQMPVDQIEKNRLVAAQATAERFGCLVVLKGFRTILATPEKQKAIILSGNAALAKAGSGDVLGGFMAGLLAQGVGSVQAAGTACYLHGRLADDWIRAGRDPRSLLARDLISLIPRLLDQIAKLP